ncbi:MAG: class I SAM-dependent methyltransferase [Pirellulaceae bacterium]
MSTSFDSNSTQATDLNSTGPQCVIVGGAESQRESRDRALFDNIAEGYAAKDCSPSCRPARKLRLRQTIDALPAASFIDKHVLEVGCGAGYAADYLPPTYASYFGIDYSQMLIDVASATHASDRVRFAAINARDLKPERPFDLIFMIGVLHHMDRRDEMVRHLVSLLTPGGWLVVNEPQPGNPLIRVARKTRKQIDTKYSDDQLELSGKEISQCFVDCGLTAIRIKPQGLFSTPFAEVPLKPHLLSRPAAHFACMIDRTMESTIAPLLGRITWNVIVAGQKPERS